MKGILPCIILLAFANTTQAQGVFSNQTNLALEKVIQDYPNNLRNIKGAVKGEHAQSTVYESSIQIPGSISCIVSHERVSKKEHYSWKAELFESEDFSVAADKYNDLFNQIRNTIVKVEGEKPYILNGHFESPARNKSSHTIIFNMFPSSGKMQKMKVELQLQQQSSIWRISLQIYDLSQKEGEGSLALKPPM